MLAFVSQMNNLDGQPPPSNAYHICSFKVALDLGRLLTLHVCAGLDGNATIGNISNAYKFAFWDGAVLPLGLGISLVLVSICY